MGGGESYFVFVLVCVCSLVAPFISGCIVGAYVVRDGVDRQIRDRERGNRQRSAKT